MILNALVDYYERLANDPEQKGVARFGFSEQKVSFCVVLNPDGSLHAFQDERVEAGKNKRPALHLVPGQAKPTGSGLNPCFLWDNAQYMLGFKPDDPKPERTAKAFETFRTRHLDLEPEIDDEGFRAVCAFLRSWDPAGAASHPELAEIAGHFGVLRIVGAHGYVHESEPVLDFWKNTHCQPTSDFMAPSLIDGVIVPIARIHEPKIKGVGGAQSSGALLVSFNKDVFESYDLSQSHNAPVGELDAFRYCNALNRLLADRDRRVRIGDATVVWWSDTPTPMESFFGAVLDDTSAEDEVTKLRVGAFLNRLRRGIVGDDLGDLDQPFYVLGLSPNASRLSVRFWLVGTVGRFAERLAQHHADLALGNWNTPDNGMTLSNLIMETARDRKDPKTVSPRLAGEVTRSILLGLPYPASLAEGVLRRIRAEGNITSRQASILKASIIRKGYDMQPHLDPTYDSAAYQCGRLFATLNYAQQIASPTVKGSMAARYLRAVMATPGLLLGRLEGLCEVGHLRKIDSDDIQTFFRDELANINAQLTPPLPKHLQGIDQSMFMLGYYKQLQWIQRVVARRGKDRPFIHRYRTARGDWVRSKLERRVIDTLHRFGIAYVYEPIRVIGDGIPRRPDLLINGATKRLDVYIEVAGGWKDMEAYNTRHESKLREYEEAGITETGEDHGFLRVLDFRDVDMTKRGWYDEKRHVIDKISDVVNLQSDSRGTEEN